MRPFPQIYFNKQFILPILTFYSQNASDWSILISGAHLSTDFQTEM